VSAVIGHNGPRLSIGIISANLMNLGEDIAVLEKCGAKYAHFDVMDGHFAPPLTVGPAFIKAVKTSMLKDVHLMIDEPLAQLADYAAAGADIITVHAEACRHPHRTLQAIGELPNANDARRPIVRGAALNPSTPVEAIEPVLDVADFVLLVAINPGFPKQKFIDATAQRLERLRALIAHTGRPIAIGIDGGVTKDNIGAVAALRPDIIVSGSAVFEQGKISENYSTMKSGITAAG